MQDKHKLCVRSFNLKLNIDQKTLETLSFFFFYLYIFPVCISALPMLLRQGSQDLPTLLHFNSAFNFLV